MTLTWSIMSRKPLQIIIKTRYSSTMTNDGAFFTQAFCICSHLSGRHLQEVLGVCSETPWHSFTLIPCPPSTAALPTTTAATATTASGPEPWSSVEAFGRKGEWGIWTNTPSRWRKRKVKIQRQTFCTGKGKIFQQKNTPKKTIFFPKSLKSYNFWPLSYVVHSSGHPWAIVKLLMSPILKFLPVSDMQSEE